MLGGAWIARESANQLRQYDRDSGRSEVKYCLYYPSYIKETQRGWGLQGICVAMRVEMQSPFVMFNVRRNFQLELEVAGYKCSLDSLIGVCTELSTARDQQKAMLDTLKQKRSTIEQFTNEAVSIDLLSMTTFTYRTFVIIDLWTCFSKKDEFTGLERMLM